MMMGQKNERERKALKEKGVREIKIQKGQK
jgi:hypothetical protein